MTYGFVTDVPAPAQLYDALHAEIMRRAASGVDGLLVHVGWATDGGFQVMEVWESKDHYDRFNTDVVAPALAHVSQGRPAQPPPPMQEFEPRGLTIPSADIFV